MDAYDAVVFCDDILNMLYELPEKANDFAEEVKEKVESMKDWIEENDTVTDAQIVALNNIKRGVEKWL